MNIQIIPLSFLVIDENIADIIQMYGGNFPSYLERNLQDMRTFKLSLERLEQIMNLKNIPPIEVKSCGSLYEVLNGRHRIAATILNGGTSILAKIHYN